MPERKIFDFMPLDIFLCYKYVKIKTQKDAMAKNNKIIVNFIGLENDRRSSNGPGE